LGVWGCHWSPFKESGDNELLCESHRTKFRKNNRNFDRIFDEISIIENPCAISRNGYMCVARVRTGLAHGVHVLGPMGLFCTVKISAKKYPSCDRALWAPIWVLFVPKDKKANRVCSFLFPRADWSLERLMYFVKTSISGKSSL